MALNQVASLLSQRLQLRLVLDPLGYDQLADGDLWERLG